MNEIDKLNETKSYVVAGLSLSRPINIDDIKWAVERGFYEGMKYKINWLLNKEKVNTK